MFVAKRYDSRAAKMKIMEACVPLAQLYTEGYLAFAFRRTYSRLKEMQLESFAKL